jgi:hypothetical protein
MRSSLRSLAATAVLAAGVAVAVPVAAHADIPDRGGAHYLALVPTQATYSVKVVDGSDGTENTYSLDRSQANYTQRIVYNSSTYDISCLDVNGSQIGTTYTLGPLASDDKLYAEVNLSTACDL